MLAFSCAKNNSQYRMFTFFEGVMRTNDDVGPSCQLSVALLLYSDCDGIRSQVSKHINKSQPGEQTH